MSVERLNVRQVRRLALARAGLLKPELTGLRARAVGRGKRARQRCHEIIGRFGYLQLDSIAISGARTQGIVLASRLHSFDADLAETLLQPGEPLFEYWGHEACWLPLSMYPTFAFRRRDYRVHPWWGDVLNEHPKLCREISSRIEAEGPLRSLDLEGTRINEAWGAKLATRVAEALWSAGELAVRERNNFQRSFDLTERVIPESLRNTPLDDDSAMDELLIKALEGHGWSTTGTLAATWRLTNLRDAINASLQRLLEEGRVIACELQTRDRIISGWIRPSDLQLVSALDGLRPRADVGVLLSPFDPLLWDRARTLMLFDFEQVLEIYKPLEQRRFGYYCLPVLAGDHLVARVDLKADRKTQRLNTLSCHLEPPRRRGDSEARMRVAVQQAVSRFAAAVSLDAGVIVQ